MEECFPSCSKDTPGNISEEIIDEIELLKGINVRTELQEELEKQALHELDNFNKNTDLDKEDGELSDTEKNPIEYESEKSNKDKNTVDLDISSYIKRQEELKKRQQFKRSLEISDKSREAASKISKKHKEHAKNKTKRKKSENDRSPNVSFDVKKSNLTLDVETSKCDASESNVLSKSPFELQKSSLKSKVDSDSEYIPSDDDLELCDVENNSESAIKMHRKKVGNTFNFSKIIDDGSKQCYKTRLAQYYEKLEQEQKLLGLEMGENEDIEVYKKLRINKRIWGNLYSYQQEAVEWLYELHIKPSGGILGDEMGLGKTVEIIAFLNALSCSKNIIDNCYKGLGATIIVCPATIIHQWVQHFHEWTPEFRVAILHQSGSFTGNKTALIKDINKDRGILITSYSGILKYKSILTELNWHYVILDEGHKIRNPNAKVSMAAKEFRTPHRIMLTGSPMQNNLQELWSLFDFTNPGMLGSLQIFTEHFAQPILHGGYANATYMQESLALSMASALRDLILPHLLRRSKQEVRTDISLPSKTEQVLFCALTSEQRDLYKGYLMGEDVSTILGRGGKNWFNENTTRANVLVAITTLRKICNHPDLYLEEEHFRKDQDKLIGVYKKSGKMIVISALLKIWKQQNHRVLLFTQSRGMIAIFEQFLTQHGYTYLKMDGSTSIRSRQPLIDKFNNDSSFDVFLLTTRVGGLGVNLTGANRVVIYDPDWNPATDTQARERAWRIGQERNVTIYRLISAGTIEEKIYQRQVWKQLLCNKILLDPKTQRFFKNSNLHDLFSLQEQTGEDQIETANIFKNSRVSMEKQLIKKKKSKKSDFISKSKIQFSDEKLRKMKELAAKISKSFSASPIVEKTLEQLDLEEEQKQRKIDKEELKKLTAPELHLFNRKKAEGSKFEEAVKNKVDEIETAVSFETALEITEKTAQIYHEVKEHRNKANEMVEEYSKLTKTINNIENPSSSSSSSSSKRKSCGEFKNRRIEGLLKSETKKLKEDKKRAVIEPTERQDQYVLDKLFSKKGIQSALQHDVIVQSGTQRNSVSHLRVHDEAKMRTDLALEALRKSKLINWRW